MTGRRFVSELSYMVPGVLQVYPSGQLPHDHDSSIPLRSSALCNTFRRAESLRQVFPEC